jgi:aerobic-type carbon monoxide dehydrogenase small subunit (CoxS/CutS family)
MISHEIYATYCEVNGRPRVSFPGIMRHHLRFTGTKCCCGMGLFGACAVHLDGNTQTAHHHFSPLMLRIMEKGRRKGGNV